MSPELIVMVSLFSILIKQPNSSDNPSKEPIILLFLSLTVTGFPTKEQ